jgi:hypothetical protein
MSKVLPRHHSPLRASASPVVVTRLRVFRCWSMLGWLLLLALASPAWSGMLRCTTYEEKTSARFHTLCDDGTRAGSRYNTTLERWETTITSSPRTSCTAHMHPYARQVERHCR